MLVDPIVIRGKIIQFYKGLTGNTVIILPIVDGQITKHGPVLIMINRCY